MTQIEQQITETKEQFRVQAMALSAEKKRLFPNPDIASPMCDEEKRLTKVIAALFSKCNTLNIELRKIRRSQSL